MMTKEDITPKLTVRLTSSHLKRHLLLLVANLILLNTTV